MKYIAKYLPVDRPWTDGCTIINSSGEHHIWDENSIGWNKEQWRVAELFIVANEFNEQVVICQPSKETMKWLKAGMEVKSWEVVRGISDSSYHIKCPTCGYYPNKE